jgi:hypothetical protein
VEKEEVTKERKKERKTKKRETHSSGGIDLISFNA